MTVDFNRLSLDNPTQNGRTVEADGGLPPLRGMVTLWNVIQRWGTYVLEIHQLLVGLEGIVQPRAVQTAVNVSSGESATLSLPSLGEASFSTLINAKYPFALPEIAPSLPRASETIFDYLDLVERDARDLGHGSTAKRLKRIRGYLQSVQTRTALDLAGDARLQDEVRVLRESLIDDLKERPIFFPDLQRYRQYHDKSFGPEVAKAFPDAVRDIKAAGNCYVTDNPTASVFHSVRVAEYGLRALAKRILPRLKATQLEWGVIIRELRKRIEELNQHGKKTLTVQRERYLNFYSEALDQCVYFKNLWRDDTVHTRANYESPDALKALTHLEEFMTALVKSGLSLPPTLPNG